MNSFRIHAGWIGLALLASVIVAAPAFGRTASSYYTPQALEAVNANWAAKGRLLGSPDAASFYTAEQLQALSTNWATKGRLIGSRDAASFYSPQQLQALSGTWAAKGRLFGATPQVTGDGGSSTFNWTDFGMGAGAMLGVVLLLGGLVAAAHYSRRGGIRPRPIS
jgi:hypothetical protein